MRKTAKFLFNRTDRLLQRLLVPCVVMMVAAQAAASDAVKSQVLRIRPGSFAEIRLAGREKLEGQVGDLCDDGFVLRTVSDN